MCKSVAWQHGCVIEDGIATNDRSFCRSRCIIEISGLPQYSNIRIACGDRRVCRRPILPMRPVRCCLCDEAFTYVCLYDCACCDEWTAEVFQCKCDFLHRPREYLGIGFPLECDCAQ